MLHLSTGTNILNSVKDYKHEKRLGGKTPFALSTDTDTTQGQTGETAWTITHLPSQD